MKIQCDVCNKAEASVFCSADEAALCDACDSRVHHANKLASKHHRFSLLNPSSSKDSPRCDICQERRAFQFCREDRALLCNECDLSIHTANEYTKKHNRFLLTGVKLSSTSSIFSPPTTTSSSTTSKTNTNNNTFSSNGCDVSIDSRTTSNISSIKKKPKPVSDDSFSSGFGTDQIQITKQSTKGSGGGGDDGGGGLDYFNQPTPSAGGSTSSISEYLIEMLPGWQVDDLLLDSSSAGFCKNDDLFFDTNFEANLSDFAATDDLTLWVPEISATTPTPLLPPASHPPLMELKEVNNNNNPNSKVMNRRWREHSLTVPQISPPSNKRSRNVW